MCGIVGYVGSKQVVPVVIEGLRRLEYRGYDSAGIAVVNSKGEMEVRRASGKLRNLETALQQKPIEGDYGLGHTRWATHGRPTEENAHPHRSSSGRICVVHNGIIENYLELKRELQKEDHRFQSETDTEVVAHLIEKHLRRDPSLGLEGAFRETLKEIRGIYALVALSADEPHKLVTARLGPPVVVGLGEGEYFVASDIPAILEHTREMFFLGDGEMAVLSREGVQVSTVAGQAVKPQIQRINWDPVQAEKGGFKHFMLKEIYEQPQSIRNALRGELIAPQARTPFQGMSGTFLMSDGVLATHDLSFNTQDLRIPGIGVIDLPQRRMDLRLAPRSPRGGVVFPFAIRGLWAQPSYNADISDRAQREISARVADLCAGRDVRRPWVRAAAPCARGRAPSPSRARSARRGG